jgi:hypothetical protein
VQILDEPADLQRQAVVAQRDRVARQPRQLIDQGDDGEEVLLDGEVKRIAVLEIEWDFAPVRQPGLQTGEKKKNALLNIVSTSLAVISAPPRAIQNASIAL